MIDVTTLHKDHLFIVYNYRTRKHSGSELALEQAFARSPAPYVLRYNCGLPSWLNKSLTRVSPLQRARNVILGNETTLQSSGFRRRIKNGAGGKYIQQNLVSKPTLPLVRDFISYILEGQSLPST